MADRIATLKRRAVIQTVLSIPALAVLLFVPAGSLRFWQGWLFAAVFIAVPMIAALAWRLLDEERLLLRDLPGYADYCRKVRYRLVPGIW